MKYYVIYLEGIDKTGKDTICNYIVKLSNGKYVVNGRGLLTLIAYDKIFNRGFSYDFELQKYVLNVFLNVNKEDWEIRCKMTNEPVINYQEHMNAFEYAKNLIKPYTNLLEYNTSILTPYSIAKNIVLEMDKLNAKEK